METKRAASVVLLLMIMSVVRANSNSDKMPLIQLEPMNVPAALANPSHRGSSMHKFDLLREYSDYYNDHVREPRTLDERKNVLREADKKLHAFVEAHTSDMKKLLVGMDKSLMAMDLITLNKKMETSESRIKASKAHIPFGVYISPEFKCLDTSYYVSSVHSQEDVQDILSSDRRPNCYNIKGAFQFSGFYHRHGENTYAGPHSEEFQMETSQGLYCSTDEWWWTQCIYKLNPRPQFPESVQYQTKISYHCGEYRYFIPTGLRVRCIFSQYRARFELWFGRDGIEYVASGVDLMYPNGQKMYTDEPWSRMSCSDYACKWRHNQNRRAASFTTD